MEWSTDTKNGYGDLEIYMEYGYVAVSTTGRNQDKMAYSLFKLKKSWNYSLCNVICLATLTCNTH